MAYLTNFPLNFLMQFSHKMSLLVFHTMVKKCQNDQKLNSRSPALNQMQQKLTCVMAQFASGNPRPLDVLHSGIIRFRVIGMVIMTFQNMWVVPCRDTLGHPTAFAVLELERCEKSTISNRTFFWSAPFVSADPFQLTSWPLCRNWSSPGIQIYCICKFWENCVTCAPSP